MLISIRPNPSAGLLVGVIAVQPEGAIKYDPKGGGLLLYRLPNGKESEQQVELQLRGVEEDESLGSAQAEALNLDTDVCPVIDATRRLPAEERPLRGQSKCHAHLDGKVYRYGAFAAQVTGRARSVIQERVEAWPRKFSMQIRVDPSAK